MNFPISHWPMILNAALKDTQAQRGETTLTKQNFLGCPIELRKKIAVIRPRIRKIRENEATRQKTKNIFSIKK